MDFGDKSPWLEKLGLPSYATETQIQEALEQHMEQRKAEHTNKIKEKLGLSGDASEEEIKEALLKWREENKGFFGGNGHKKFGFHNGRCMN